jgi:mono/diheme cytochrome c family protein
MFRQPSYLPLDSPRAAPPATSVPVNPTLAPFDSHPVVSPAWGDREAVSEVKNIASFPSKEPDLPPPNLSDNARNEPAPASVNALKNPLPTGARLINAGHDLFLNRCVQCHDAGGYGYGPVGQYLLPHPPDLASPLVQKQSEGALFWHITMGQGKMPGFRHWTTPSERWLLVEYVRSMKAAKPGQFTDDTFVAPYPVYGEPGFENGQNLAPHHVIPRPPSNVNQSAEQSQAWAETPGKSQ